MDQTKTLTISKQFSDCARNAARECFNGGTQAAQEVH